MSRTFIQFSGTGYPFHKDLLRLVSSRPEASALFHDCVEAVSAAARRMEYCAVARPEIYPALLDSENTALEYDGRIGIAGTAIMHALILLETLDRDPALLENIFAGTGHSQGIVFACILAERISERAAFRDNLIKAVRFLSILAIRGQELFQKEIEEDELLIEHMRNLRFKGIPTAMFALTGEHTEISDLINRFNHDMGSRLEIILHNGTRNKIIGGTRNQLCAFLERAKQQKTNVRLRYFIRCSCPFHHSALTPLLEKFERDLEWLEAPWQAGNLQWPVYSFVDGSNLQKCDNLVRHMYRAVTMEVLHWDRALSWLSQDGIEKIVDFGPGNGALSFSEEWCQERNLKIDFESPYEKILSGL